MEEEEEAAAMGKGGVVGDGVGEGEGELVWEGVKEGVGVELASTASVMSDTP